jgi:uncharacterized protein YjbI with pentapeptide repeats
VATDFTGADLRGASMEDTSMEDAILTQADARGAYFSRTLEDVKSIEGADFADAQLPPKLLPILCERADINVKNKVTGETTAESLMCP